MDRLKLFDKDGDSSDEDLYEALKKQGRVDSSDSDSEESSSGEEELKKPNAKLFESDDEDSDEEEDTASMKKGKPMYLKDVVSKQLIEAGPELSDEEDGSGDDGENNKLKSYSQEQEELRKQIVKSLEQIGKSKDHGDVDVNISEDEDEVEKQEDYERELNFRFEENAGDRVMGHSRKVEGSVRKKDNARKSQRERKEERMAQAEFERKEELKRLKNLKKKEIKEKLEKIREVAGTEGIFLDKDDLEDEFDPEAHDKKMNEAFGEEYYGAEDVDPQFGTDDDEDEDLEKPDFDKEDELLGLDKGWDEVDKSGEGFKSFRERIMKDRLASGEEEKDGEDEGNQRGNKRKRKHKPSEVEKAVIEELLDEYYKLDYEDTIGDLKTRFKYRPVKAKRFGLSAEEILALDDKELNQYVSLKKIAPYRENEWKVPRIKTIQLKQSKYRKGNTSKAVDEDRKGKGKEVEVNAVGSEKSRPMELNGEEKTVSRKRKRKQEQAELKISQSRLMAYEKIPSKSKSKNCFCRYFVV
ncbi:hypothetical protein SASPL_104213 [Salvia splendens]|uniref:Kri1-like C-terminal domain-containing protein n=1 Tax=Salvia splendens TaxID=180675 RepID=A0A8X9A7H7_SALSN|nr:hypothetical protein SASPL_104213 [Salvia splendens]